MCLLRGTDWIFIYISRSAWSLRTVISSHYCHHSNVLVFTSIHSYHKDERANFRNLLTKWQPLFSSKTKCLSALPCFSLLIFFYYILHLSISLFLSLSCIKHFFMPRTEDTKNSSKEEEVQRTVTKKMAYWWIKTGLNDGPGQETTGSVRITNTAARSNWRNGGWTWNGGWTRLN